METKGEHSADGGSIARGVPPVLTATVGGASQHTLMSVVAAPDSDSSMIKDMTRSIQQSIQGHMLASSRYSRINNLLEFPSLAIFTFLTTTLGVALFENPTGYLYWIKMALSSTAVFMSLMRAKLGYEKRSETHNSIAKQYSYLLNMTENKLLDSGVTDAIRRLIFRDMSGQLNAIRQNEIAVPSDIMASVQKNFAAECTDRAVIAELTNLSRQAVIQHNANVMARSSSAVGASQLGLASPFGQAGQVGPAGQAGLAGFISPGPAHGGGATAQSGSRPSTKGGSPDSSPQPAAAAGGLGPATGPSPTQQLEPAAFSPVPRRTFAGGAFLDVSPDDTASVRKRHLKGKPSLRGNELARLTEGLNDASPLHPLRTLSVVPASQGDKATEVRAAGGGAAGAAREAKADEDLSARGSKAEDRQEDGAHSEDDAHGTESQPFNFDQISRTADAIRLVQQTSLGDLLPNEVSSQLDDRLRDIDQFTQLADRIGLSSTRGKHGRVPSHGGR